MRITYKNTGVGKGANIELSTKEAMKLVVMSEANSLSDSAIEFSSEVLKKLEKAILHGDSEAEEGGDS